MHTLKVTYLESKLRKALSLSLDTHTLFKSLLWFGGRNTVCDVFFFLFLKILFYF